MRLRGVRCRAVPEAFGCAGGGATTAWRLNDKTLSQLGRAGGGAKDKKFDADRGFSPPRVELTIALVRSQAFKSLQLLSRGVRLPTQRAEGPAQPGEAKHQPPAPAPVDARRRSVYEEAPAIRNVGS